MMKRRLGFALIAVIAVVAALSWGLIRAPEDVCGSGAIDRGNGWHEIGGPIAFLLYDPPYVGPVTARMAWVRITAPADGRSLTVDVRERHGSGGSGNIQAKGLPVSAFEPTVRPTSDLPGRMHFVTLDFPSTGCWKLDFRVGDERAGIAAIPVVPLRTDLAPDG